MRTHFATRFLSNLSSAGIIAATFLCVVTARAQEEAQPAKEAAPQTEPVKADPAMPDTGMKMIEQAKPKGIPVPDMTVVATSEVEGVKIEDMKIGDGAVIKRGAMVLAHYHGTLVDGGKVFDSSFERGEPAAFPLGGVIRGWQVGVPGMKVGGIRRLTIPSELGYGDRGAGGAIPPSADLVFVIQAVGTIESEDLKVGEGDPASAFCVAVTAYTMKDESGKVIESATTEKPYILVPQEFAPMNSGIEGMKAGGKRIIKVPKEFNKPNPQAPPTNRPTDVALTIEVELLVLRNLQ